MFDFDFLSRFDELSFRANLAKQGTGSRTSATSRNKTKTEVSPNWYEEMLRKIRESVEGVTDEKESADGSGIQIQKRQRLEAERQKQQMMLDYYNAMRSNPFAVSTSSSVLDAYLAAAGRNGDGSDALLDYTLRNMGNGLF